MRRPAAVTEERRSARSLHCKSVAPAPRRAASTSLADHELQKFYDDMLVTRDYWVSRARRSAALTIPYLIPRSNEPVQENMDTYVLPWNGIGARGTTNLASKLLMALLPPTEAFFRFTVDPVAMEEQEVAMQEQGASDDEIAELKSNMELALNKLETGCQCCAASKPVTTGWCFTRHCCS